MRDRLALRPDLNECTLEDRCLLYAPGLSNAFLPINSTTNQISVPGTNSSGGSGGGNNVKPGPTFYYVTVGVSFGSGFAGVSPGSTVSIYSVRSLASTSGGGGGGSSGGGASSSPTSSTRFGTDPNLGGYSSSFSSGYNFSLGPSNNYGMTSNIVGSVPVHTYGGGGDIQEAPEHQDSTAGSTSTRNQSPINGGTPSLPGILAPGVGTLGPGSNLWKSLLGKPPGLPTTMPTGPDRNKP